MWISFSLYIFAVDEIKTVKQGEEMVNGCYILRCEWNFTETNKKKSIFIKCVEMCLCVCVCARFGFTKKFY